MRLDLAREFLGPVEVLEGVPEGSPAMLSAGLLRVAGRSVRIRAGVPRFVEDEGYAANFALQWNRYRLTQLDSHTGLPLTAQRLWSTTRWSPEALKGARVLEAGSGAGRFTQVMLGAGARVCSFDLSSAAEVNARENAGKGELLVMQADIYDLPVPDAHFDFVFCHGVLQHLPDAARAWRVLLRKVKPGGWVSVDSYLKLTRPSPWSTPKYFWRPLTRRMPPALLLKVVQAYVPRWLPVDTALRRIPRIGPGLVSRLRIPCWNYWDTPGLSPTLQKEWAVLDTFDALGARYDEPRTVEELRALLQGPEVESCDVFVGGNGAVGNVRRRGGP